MEILNKHFEEVQLSIDINDMFCAVYILAAVNIKMCVIRQITVFELSTSRFEVKDIHQKSGILHLRY